MLDARSCTNTLSFSGVARDSDGSSDMANRLSRVSMIQLTVSSKFELPEDD